jgi:hypothetical protein
VKKPVKLFKHATKRDGIRRLNYPSGHSEAKRQEETSQETVKDKLSGPSAYICSFVEWTD